MTKAQVGWYIVRDGQHFRNQYETAAWYQEIQCQAQRVPIMATQKPDGTLDQHLYLSGFEGILVDDYFASLWCGVPIPGAGDGKSHDKYGKPATVQGWMVRDYELAEMVAQGHPSYELLPEWQARPSYTTHDTDGKFASKYDRLRIAYHVVPADAPWEPPHHHSNCDLAGCAFEPRIRAGYDWTRHLELIRLREWGCKSFEIPCGGCLKPTTDHLYRRGNEPKGLCHTCRQGGRTDLIGCRTCTREGWLDRGRPSCRQCPDCFSSGVIARSEFNGAAENAVVPA